MNVRREGHAKSSPYPGREPLWWTGDSNTQKWTRVIPEMRATEQTAAAQVQSCEAGGPDGSPEPSTSQAEAFCGHMMLRDGANMAMWSWKEFTSFHEHPL